MKCTLRCDMEGFVVTKKNMNEYRNDLTLLCLFTCRLRHRDLYPCCGNQKA